MYDKVDYRGVPVSKGVPNAVMLAGILGLLAIFAIGGATILMGSYGHLWPASHTLRMDLNSR